MNKKNAIKFFAVIGLAGAISLSAIGVYAYQDQEARLQQRDKMQTAFENNDYNAWKGAMEEKVKGMQDRITEENFSNMSEIHKLKQEGKFDEAQQKMEELGIQKGFGKKGFKGNFDPAKKEQMQQILESRDYNAWKELMKEHPRKGEMSEEDFNKIADWHDAKIAGDYEKMKELKQEKFGKGMKGNRY